MFDVCFYVLKNIKTDIKHKQNYIRIVQCNGNQNVLTLPAWLASASKDPALSRILYFTQYFTTTSWYSSTYPLGMSATSTSFLSFTYGISTTFSNSGRPSTTCLSLAMWSCDLPLYTTASTEKMSFGWICLKRSKTPCIDKQNKRSVQLSLVLENQSMPCLSFPVSWWL